MTISRSPIVLLATLLILATACAPASKYKPQPVGPAAAPTAEAGAAPSTAVPGPAPLAEEEEFPETAAPSDSEIADPIEPFNRAMYVFNDKMYFWVLKPVAQGYSNAVPEGGRIAIRNFFNNLRMPIRFASCVLQFRLIDAQRELVRFVINTTAGGLGFFDVAYDQLKLEPANSDIGLTLGSYGIDNGIYIVWPVFGPSTLRDTVGSVGDSALDPVNYLPPWYTPYAVQAYRKINETSLSLGSYEALKASALEPYSAIRNAYVQYRWEQVRQQRQ